MSFRQAERPRRILMTADSIGGIWTYSLDLCRSLKPFGIEITLAVMGGAPSTEQMQEARKIENLRVIHSSLKLEWMPDPWLEVEQASEWLLQIADHFKPDLIHLNHYTFGSLPWEAPVLMVAHSCVYTWWRSVLNEEPPLAYRTYYKKVKQGLEGASILIAPTQDFLNQFSSTYGYRGEKHVIPNARFISGKITTCARKRQAIAVGRAWDASKNFATLDHAAENLKLPIRLLGNLTSPEGKIFEYRNLDALGLRSSAEVRELLHESEIYIHPAKYEPFGLAVLEAAQAGCALVLSDLPSLRENWEDAALFFHPDNSDGLRNALIRVSQDDAFRASLSRAAIRRSAEFSIESSARRYFSTYCQLLEKDLNEDHLVLPLAHF